MLTGFYCHRLYFTFFNSSNNILKFFKTPDFNLNSLTFVYLFCIITFSFLWKLNILRAFRYINNWRKFLFCFLLIIILLKLRFFIKIFIILNKINYHMSILFSNLSKTLAEESFNNKYFNFIFIFYKNLLRKWDMLILSILLILII